MESERNLVRYFFMSLLSVAMGAAWDCVAGLSHEQPTTEARTQTARQERIRFFIFSIQVLSAPATDWFYSPAAHVLGYGSIRIPSGTSAQREAINRPSLLHHKIATSTIRQSPTAC
jgi:hypothetical protein